MDQQLTELTKDVYQIKANMLQINSLVERLDDTISKLSEVSSSISELLAVQSLRLEAQEKITEKIFNTLEKQKYESDSDNKELKTNLKIVEKELYTEIDKKYELILKELKGMKEVSTKEHIEVNERLMKLEKWIWVVSGGAVVFGFIISKLSAILPKFI